MAENRRTHPRKPVTFRVDYADAQGRTSMGLARNISLGGMYLEDAPQVSVGGTITVVFEAHVVEHGRNGEDK